MCQILTRLSRRPEGLGVFFYCRRSRVCSDHPRYRIRSDRRKPPIYFSHAMNGSGVPQPPRLLRGPTKTSRNPMGKLTTALRYVMGRNDPPYVGS